SCRGRGAVANSLRISGQGAASPAIPSHLGFGPAATPPAGARAQTGSRAWPETALVVLSTDVTETPGVRALFHRVPSHLPTHTLTRQVTTMMAYGRRIVCSKRGRRTQMERARSAACRAATK